MQTHIQHTEENVQKQRLKFDCATLTTSKFNNNETKFKDFNREENKAPTLRDS